MTITVEKRKRGRPATYACAAERAKAWRQRQRDLIESARTTAPTVIEKIVEIERVVEKRVPTAVKSTKLAHSVPNASQLFPLLKERFTGYQGEETAKRFRTNAAKAASAAREILSLAQRGGPVPEVEDTFLRQAAQFFEHLNGIFQNAQTGAKRAAAKAKAEWETKHELKIKELVVLTFGASPVAADVLATGQQLLDFEKAGPEWLTKRFAVDRAYVHLYRAYELKKSLRDADVAKVAREVAENRLELMERGRLWKDEDQKRYSAGWMDFEAYRASCSGQNRPL